MTYSGHPLYYFAGDAASGDTNGHDLDQYGAEWYALTPAGGEAGEDEEGETEPEEDGSGSEGGEPGDDQDSGADGY